MILPWTNPTQPNPTQCNSTQLNPTQPNPTQPNPTQLNSTQPNPTQPNPTQLNSTQPKPLGVIFCLLELWVMSCHRSVQVLVTKCAVRQLFGRATPTKPKQNKKEKETLHKSIVPSKQEKRYSLQVVRPNPISCSEKEPTHAILGME